MYNCDESEIKGNLVTYSSTGIYIEESDYCELLDNVIENNGCGMLVAFSKNVVIANNFVVNNNYEGIATDTGDYALIKDNYCAYNQYGVFALLATD